MHIWPVEESSLKDFSRSSSESVVRIGYSCGTIKRREDNALWMLIPYHLFSNLLGQAASYSILVAVTRVGAFLRFLLHVIPQAQPKGPYRSLDHLH